MIKGWISCPKQMHFKDILKIPEGQHAKTTYGTCIHDALETYNSDGDIKASIERFKETWENPSLLNAEITVWPPKTTWGELKMRGVQALEIFHENSKWETRTILATEHKFVVPFGDHVLSGIVDSLETMGPEKKPKELRVIDYKTSYKTPTHMELRFDIQFSIYLYASQQAEFWEGIKDGEEHFERLSGTQRRGVWYSLWNHKMTDVGVRTEEDMMRLYRVLLEIEKAVENEVYVPNLTGESCMWCSYTDYCAVVIPVRHVLDEARAERIR